MRRKIIVALASIAAVCLAGLLSANFSNGAVTAAPPAVPDTPEVAEVKQAILVMREVTNEAYISLDPSRLASVYVNDLRGGQLGAAQLKRVQSEWRATADPRMNNPAIAAGYLDYQHAELGWLKHGVEKREALERKAASEGRSLTDQEQRVLVDADGQIPPARPERSDEPLPQPTFQAVTVNGDNATAVVDGGPVTSEFTLVKLHGKWFVAGEKTLSVHF